MRATLRCADESGVPAQQEVIDGIDETVQELTQAQVVVILACHDSTGTDLVLDSALDLQVRAFWDEVVPRYQDNPCVWFNFFNEPRTKFDPEVWLELHRFYYDRYRSKGAENIMVFDLPNFGQGFDLLAGDTFADGLGGACNTLFGWHTCSGAVECGHRRQSGVERKQLLPRSEGGRSITDRLAMVARHG